MTISTLKGPQWNSKASDEQGESQDDGSKHLVPINQGNEAEELTPGLGDSDNLEEGKDKPDSDNSEPGDEEQPHVSDDPKSEDKDKPDSDNPDTEDKENPHISDDPESEGKDKPDSDNPDTEDKENPHVSDDPESEGKDKPDSDNPDTEDKDDPVKDNPDKDKNCWVGLEAKEHFDTMSKIEAEYEESRKTYQDQVGGNTFDIEMLEVMLKKRGMADRAVEAADGDAAAVPAGLNLGGYCMMRMQNSVLFFHRLKLRNSTHFRINFLKNDLYDMLLTARISLNDIHLAGSYERALTDSDPSNLFYTPSNGFADFLLRGVEYKVEGRYRMIEDRLKVEMIISDIAMKEALVVFMDKKQQESTPVPIPMSSLDDFLDKLKTDLNEWLKDYFNDYLLFSEISSTQGNTKVKLFDKQKTQALNTYMERVIKLMKQRQQELGMSSLRLPDFTINSQHGLKIKLTDGVLHGADSMYRRSVATGYLMPNTSDNGPRKVDATVGFSNLKVVYKYKAQASPAAPELGGLIYLSSNELAAHLGLTLVKDPETADLLIDQIQMMKPESLTVEGPANRMIVIYRHLLEHHILAMLTNTLGYTIKSLASLTKCEPDLRGYVEPGDEKTVSKNENKTPDQDSDSSGVTIDNDNENIPQGTNLDGRYPKSDSDHKQNENIFMANENESMEVKVPDLKGDEKVVHIQKIVKNVIKERPEDGGAKSLEEKDTNADFVVKDIESIELQVPNHEGETKNLHVQRIEKYLVSERPGTNTNHDTDENGDKALKNYLSGSSSNDDPGSGDVNPGDGEQSPPGLVDIQDPTKDKFMVKETESLELNVPDEKGNPKKVHVQKVIKKVIQERPEGGDHQSKNDESETSEENDKVDFVVKDVESLEVRVPNSFGKTKNVHVHQIEKFLISVPPGDDTNLISKPETGRFTKPGSNTMIPNNYGANDNVKSGDDLVPGSNYRPETNSDLEGDQNKFIVKENESIELKVPDPFGNEKNLHVQKIKKNVIKERVEGDKTEEDESLQDNEKADFIVKDTESIELGVPDAKGIDKNVHVYNVEKYLVSERPSPGADKISEPEKEPDTPDENDSSDDNNGDSFEKENNPADLKIKDEKGETQLNYPKSKDKADFVVRDTQSMELKVPDEKGDVKKLHIEESKNILVSEIPSGNEQNGYGLRTAAPNEKNNKGQIKKAKLRTKKNTTPKKEKDTRTVKKNWH